jgi:hypothetical protein
LEKPFDTASYFELNNPQLHVLDSSASGISVKKILELWDSLSADKTTTSGGGAGGGGNNSGSGASGGSGSSSTAASRRTTKASREEQVIPAATHKLTMALDGLLAHCADASQRIDRLFQG